MFTKLRRWGSSLRGRQLLRPDVSIEYEVLGTDYGGWPVAVSGVGPETVVLSFGTGEDISFDLGIIERFGCKVHVFDPTPKSVTWMTSQSLPERLVFHPIGIDQSDGDAQLYSPPNPEHVSFAINPTQSAKEQFSITARMMRLETILEELGIPSPDILKLDIEGFEYRVIADILSGSIRPRQLLVEFHHGKYGIDVGDTEISVGCLKEAGYRIFYISSSGHEYGFIRS